MNRIYKFEKFILLEKSFYNISYDDVFTDEYKRNFKKEDFYKNSIEVFKSRNFDYDDVDDENIDMEEYDNFITNVLDNNYEEFHNAMRYLIDKDGNIILWRAMSVNDDWLSKIENGNIRIGEYWSWEEDSAEAHWSEGHDNNVLIKIKIKEYYVDWKVSYEMNIHPSFNEEREIRLYKNTPIKIEEIIFNDEEIDPSIFANKVYKA